MLVAVRGRYRAVAAALTRSLLLPLCVAAVGVLAGQWLTVDTDAHGGAYSYVTYALLAVGLYGSASGISRPEQRSDVYRIVLAITVGVAVKAAFIAAVLALVFLGRPEYLVLAVAMAQIDPLSVSAMLDGHDMSPRAKSLLAAWASFDDPVTTVLVVVLSSMVLDGAQGAAAGTADSSVSLLLNLLLLLAAAAVWRLVRHRPPLLQVLALAALMAVAAWQFLMLGLALSALFFRPPLGRWIGRTTNAAFLVATFLLGVLLARGMSPGAGLVLGCATFTAQILVGAALSWDFPARDRLSLCLSQQNGITAIILALLLEPLLPDAVAVIAPAILTVNVLHVLSEALTRPSLSGGSRPEGPDDLGEALRG
jgi:hypothetical protein